MVRFGSFRDCAGKRYMYLGCFHAFYSRSADAVEKGIDAIGLGMNNNVEVTIMRAVF